MNEKRKDPISINEGLELEKVVNKIFEEEYAKYSDKIGKAVQSRIKKEAGGFLPVNTRIEINKKPLEVGRNGWKTKDGFQYYNFTKKLIIIKTPLATKPGR